MPKLQCCGPAFYADEFIRLHVSTEWKHVYKFQDVMIRSCPKCGKRKMGWQGIHNGTHCLLCNKTQSGTICDALHKIKQRYEKEWDTRLETDVAILDDRYDPKGVDCVWASRHICPYDKRLVSVY